MRVQFASTPTPPAPSVVTSSGGTITAAKAGTWYFWIYCRNRAGHTLYSSSTSVAIAVGEQVTITLASAIRQTGSEIFEIGIVGATTDSSSSGCVLATYPGFISGSPSPLPAQVVLDRDEQLETFKQVTDLGSLPGASDVVHGMRRYVDSEAQTYEYDFYSTSWVIVYPQTFNPYVTDTTGLNGADRDVSEIDDESVIFINTYTVDGSESDTTTFWIVNDTTSTIGSGARVRMATTFDDLPIDTTEEPAAGLLLLTFLGHVDTSTGILDTSNMVTGVDYEYQGDQLTNLVTQKDLLPGEAYVLQVKAAFNPYAVHNRAFQGSLVRFYPRFAEEYAAFNPIGQAFGDFIAPGEGLRRILPNGTGLSAIAATGSGVVGEYSFRNRSIQTVPGITSGTANQKIIINNNGVCYQAASVPAALAALRAIAGTIDGTSVYTGWQSIGLDNTSLLTVDVTHPTAIDPLYPDIIAGTTATLNSTKVRVYYRTGGGAASYSDVTVIGTPGTTEQITIGSTAGSAGEPKTSHDGIGLFIPSVSTVGTTSGSSVFSTATYEVAIAYVFEGTLTSLDHSTDSGCIFELDQTLSDIIDSITPESEIINLILNLSSSNIDITEFLLSANNLSDLDNASTARTNLGLGTAAIINQTDIQNAINATVTTHDTDAAAHANMVVEYSQIDAWGGTNGQLLQSAGDGSTNWHTLVFADVTSWGGTNGQVLTSAGDGTASFQNAASSFDPNAYSSWGGTANQFWISDGDGTSSWHTLVFGDVTAWGGTNGQVLTSAGDGTASFQAPASSFDPNAYSSWGGTVNQFWISDGDGTSSWHTLVFADVTSWGGSAGQILESNGDGTVTFAAPGASLDPIATQTEMENGTETAVRRVTPERVSQAVSAQTEAAYNAAVTAASQVEIETGTEAAIRRLSPLRIAQAIAAQAASAYNAAVALATQLEMETGTETAVRRMSPKLVADAIAAQSSGGTTIKTFGIDHVTTGLSGPNYPTANVWQKRPLNTTNDPDSFLTLNQFDVGLDTEYAEVVLTPTGSGIKIIEIKFLAKIYGIGDTLTRVRFVQSSVDVLVIDSEADDGSRNILMTSVAFDVTTTTTIIFETIAEATEAGGDAFGGIDQVSGASGANYRHFQSSFMYYSL